MTFLIPYAGSYRRTFEWNSEQVALLKSMWEDGHSASEVARALGSGVSRSAVIGKVARLHLIQGEPRWTTAPKTRRRMAPLPKPEKATKPKPRVHAAKPPAPEPVVVVTEKPIESALPLPLLVTFDDLENGMCRFPYGNSPYRYCGQPAEPGTSWCPHHRSVCFEKKTQRDIDNIAAAVRSPMGLSKSIVTGMW